MSNKEGSVRKKGKYVELRVWIGGKQKSFYGKNEAEARRKAREFSREARKNEKKEVTISTEEKSKELFGEYLYNFLVTYKYQKIKDSSYDILERIYFNQISRHDIAKIPLSSVNSEVLQKFLNELNLNYATSTLKKVIEVIHPALEMAVINEVFKYNPLRLVKLPVKQNVIDVEHMEEKSQEFCYTEEEAQKLTDECMRHYGDSTRDDKRYRYAPAFVLLLNTGMRIGELAALTWDDIGENTLRINKTVTIVENRGRYKGKPKRVSIITTPKTKNSTRIIPLNTTSKIVLQELKKRQYECKINSKFVVSSPNGDFMQTRILYQTFKRICDENGIQCKGLHALRHTFGSLLISKGTDIKVVSTILGHSTVKFTYDRYIHIIGDMQASAVNLINTTQTFQG